MGKRVNFFVAALVLSVSGLTGMPSASATQVGQFVISGTGTISPGLTAFPGAQTFKFVGSGTNVGTGPSTIYCGATGSGLADDYAEGAGSLSAVCSLSVTTMVFTCTWERSGVEVEFACADTTPQSAHGDCAFVPDQAPPLAVTSFSLTCTGSFVA